MKKIAVVGSGGWGTAIAIAAEKKGHEVVLWSAFEAEIARICADSRENRRYLPGVKIPERILLSADKEKLRGADMVILAVPSQAMRAVLRQIGDTIGKGVVIVNVAKGFERKTHLRMSQLVNQELGDVKYCVLSGPSHAEEVSRGLPTMLVAASYYEQVAKQVQEMFMCESLRIYTHDDVVGVELGGALKNVIALVCGVCDGMGYADNTKAAIITRGVMEMSRLGVRLGGRAETFNGLTGIGDLIVTCTSSNSRNLRAGRLIGQGVPPQQAIEQIGMAVEGYHTAEAVYEMALFLNARMPIFTKAYEVLYEGYAPKQALYDLMLREKKDEF